MDEELSVYERRNNRREALHAAVNASHGHPDITQTEQIMEIAEEFFQWIVKPEIKMSDSFMLEDTAYKLLPGAKYRDPLTDLTFTYDGEKWVQDK